MDKYTKAIQSIFKMGDTTSIEDYVNTFSDPAQVLLAYSVFFPEFTDVEGHPVLPPISNDQANSLSKSLNTNPASNTLSSYRWTEVPYLFNNRTSLDDEQDFLLAQLIAKTWLIKLSNDYPQKIWETKVLLPEETGSVVGVSFNEI